MTHYREPRKITFAQVRPGDLVYLPYGDAVIEVYSVRPLVVPIDGRWQRIVSLSGWLTPQRGGAERWAEDGRQRADHRAYVLGDLRGIKSYEGEERALSARLRPIHVDRPLKAGVALGAVVKYHGTRTDEHWSTFYVEDIDAKHRLTLRDRDYPDVTVLRNVAPVHVTPTGETITQCECGHEAGSARATWGGEHCEIRDCGCTRHGEQRTYESGDESAA